MSHVPFKLAANNVNQYHKDVTSKMLTCSTCPCANHKTHVQFICHCSASLARESLVYSYGRSISGFAARLTYEEVAKLSG